MVRTVRAQSKLVSGAVFRFSTSGSALVHSLIDLSVLLSQRLHGVHIAIAAGWRGALRDVSGFGSVGGFGRPGILCSGLPYNQSFKPTPFHGAA